MDAEVTGDGAVAYVALCYLVWKLGGNIALDSEDMRMFCARQYSMVIGEERNGLREFYIVKEDVLPVDPFSTN